MVVQDQVSNDIVFPNQWQTHNSQTSPLSISWKTTKTLKDRQPPKWVREREREREKEMAISGDLRVSATLGSYHAHPRRSSLRPSKVSALCTLLLFLTANSLYVFLSIFFSWILSGFHAIRSIFSLFLCLIHVKGSRKNWKCRILSLVWGLEL